MIWLTNDTLRLSVCPELGARINDLIDLRSGKNWLWHASRHEPRPRMLPIGAPFDEHFQGGWDDIFPSDAAGQFMGRDLPDHGELWSQSWALIDETRNSLSLRYDCKTVPVSVEKFIRIHPSNPTFELRYLFQNRSEQVVPFLFKLHPALAIEPGDSVLLPDCLVEPVELGFSTLIGRKEKTPFPIAYSKTGDEVDLRPVRSPNPLMGEFFYTSHLNEGWCGLWNTRTGTAFRIHFDRQQLPYAWIFQSYGKWRGHYVMMTEPSTTIPYDLQTAYDNHTCGILHPQGRYEVTLQVELEQQNRG